MEVALCPGSSGRERSMYAPRLIGLLAALSCAAAAAQAQYPQRRDGFWIGFGLGYGSSHVPCGHCGTGPRKDGLTGVAKLGGPPRRNVLLRGGVSTWPL